MVPRKFWIQKLLDAWEDRSIIWLAGVRRAGKTYLCRSLGEIEYFDCELPRVRQQMEDPKAFLEGMAGKRLVLDEIHRLDNPSELLKIAADYYPNTQIVATGSSTLGASRKFRDTLTGRKTLIHLPPMLYHELADFDGKDLQHRFLYGGLPPFFLKGQLVENSYQEWLSSYWAKDVQELYHLEKRDSFMKFTELLLAQSGAMFEAAPFASACEVSRSTITNYLSVLEATYVVYIVRPFSSRASVEIKSAPKIYGFDTGFVCHSRGWNHLRPEDLGQLWEHLVLTELKGQFQCLPIHYWRDKRGHEIDFVLHRGRNHNAETIECKWSVKKFDPTNLRSFRKRYPEGKNYVVAADVEGDFKRNYDDLMVHFVSLPQLIRELS